MATSLHTPTQDELFDMANLGTKDTGLPFVVWMSVGNGILHDVRVKITKEPKVVGSEFITVGLRPDVHVIQGTMAGSDVTLLKNWIALNLDAITKYWTGEIDSIDVITAIKPLPVLEGGTDVR